MSGAIDQNEFRSALGAFATGVTIVTATDKAQGDVGVTANSFNSVSLDPPMVLWSLARKSSSLPVFEAADHFAVHVLASDQEALSNRFARGTSAEKFAGLEFERGAGGSPLLTGTAARFECRMAYRYDGGDHVIFVGQVEAFERSDRPALLFHSGRYALAARRAANLEQAQPEAATADRFGEDFLGYLLGRAHYQAYGRIRPVLERLELSLVDHFALSVLGLRGPADIQEINALIGYTGYRFDPAVASDLEKRDLVVPVDHGKLELSEAGRRKFLEAAAAAKAIEDEMLEILDPSEADLLRHLLKRVIHGTDPGLPRLWLEDGSAG
ncbi:flavin reductase family protein [Tsuneonella aeria]|nr:flavin reductase family protein [Tsuneonella aeria]